jgi:hypothetical protein
LKRILLVLAIAALLVVMLAVPAFAVPNPNANCVGVLASSEVPELAGEDDFDITKLAQEERDPLDAQRAFIARSAGNHCATE